MRYNEELEKFVHGRRLKIVRAQVTYPNPTSLLSIF